MVRTRYSKPHEGDSPPRALPMAIRTREPDPAERLRRLSTEIGNGDHQRLPRLNPTAFNWPSYVSEYHALVAPCCAIAQPIAAPPTDTHRDNRRERPSTKHAKTTETNPKQPRTEPSAHVEPERLPVLSNLPNDRDLDQAERLRLTEAVFEYSLEGVIVCDQEFRILMVNPAFTAITGHSAEEAVGKTPAILSSGRHDPGFYQEMWEMIETSGHWEGEIWNKRKTGEMYPEYLSITAIKDDDSTCRYIGVFTDITHRKLSDRQIHRLVHYDSLTDLPNRDLFLQQLKSRLVRAKANRRRVGVAYVDVDRFKAVNDSLGHSEGDKLLQVIANRLKQVLRCGDRNRPCDVVARIGGDEFAILIDDLARTEDAALVAQKLLDRINQPISLTGLTLNMNASLGIATYPDDGDNVDDLLRNADLAMYQAKQLGRGRYQFFTADLRRGAQRQLSMRRALGEALDNQQFRLVYQPQVSTFSGVIRGIEVLLRWDHPQWGEVSPLEFIPILEENGEIERVGQWLIDQACRQAVRWKSRSNSPLRIAVNLSARQFRDGDIVAQIDRALVDTELPSSCLEVELTESLAMANVDVTNKVLTRMRELGVRVSIDDFGTGYSSLSYLQHFRVDALKIDRSFIHRCVDNPHHRNLTRSIIALAKAMDLEIVAEGVETDAQRQFLAEQYVDLLQGHLFSRPIEAAAIEDLIDAQNRSSLAQATGGEPDRYQPRPDRVSPPVS